MAEPSFVTWPIQPAGVAGMRPGLAGLPHLEMTWSTPGYQYPGKGVPGSNGSPPCTLSNDCVANPVMQTASNLPSGTSAPNTVFAIMLPGLWLALRRVERG